LIKAVLALRQGQVPPHLHFRTPSPHIPWDTIPVQVPTQLMAWPEGNGRRVAGVSAFGFSGTNGHLIVEEAPPTPTPTPTTDRPLHLLALSARSDEALRQQAVQLAEHLRSDAGAALADICFTVNTGRSPFAHRLAVVADTPAQARERLEAVSAGR